MSMACCIRRTRRNSWPFFVRSASASTTGMLHWMNGPVHLSHDRVHSSCLANCSSFNSPSATPSHAATRSRSNQVLTYSVFTISTAICSLIALVYLYQCMPKHTSTFVPITSYVRARFAALGFSGAFSILLTGIKRISLAKVVVRPVRSFASFDNLIQTGGAVGF